MTCLAHDTDIYTAGGEGVKPNILLIIDNSGSMLSYVPTGTGTDYNPAGNYPSADPKINVDYVYEDTGDWFTPLKVYKTSISQVACSKARDKLSTKGVYYGKTNSACDKDSKALATGRWLNYYKSYDGDVALLSKADITKRVITDLLETIGGVNVGLMIFNHDEFGGKVITYIQDIDVDINRTKLINDVNAIENWSGTPLGKALYEAGLYFQGAPSYFNAPLNYSTPTQASCQKNFVIMMTDGEPDPETDPLQVLVGDKDGDGKEPGDGKDYLDDVAKDLYDRDLCPTLEGKQNVVTYTIDFLTGSSTAKSLLARAAMHGHGKSYTTSNYVNLIASFMSIFNEILSKNSSYVAPVVPVSKVEKSTAGDKLYLGLFRPKMGAMWSGNLKKYGVQQTNDTSKGLVIGDILDVSGVKAIDSSGGFYPATKSFWTTSSSDGGDVEKGGVGEVLKNRNFSSDPRMIYTYLGTDINLTLPSNAFSKTNASITAALLNVSTTDDKNKLVDFIHGIDSWDDNFNGDTTDKRDWLLGSFLHSRPYVLHYSDRTVIYAGSNDGMLHAFDDSNGKELWAFIPRDFLGRLIDLHSLSPGLFVDGSPKAYVSYDVNGNMTKVILIFGMRRGGNKYYALDVTDPLIPKFAWKIDPDTMSDYAEMGESWSSPVIGKVKIGMDDKGVAFIGGGYDNGQDVDNPPADDRGRAIYVVDVLTGALVKRFSFAENSAMIYSIPSDMTALDMDGDGDVDRLYVGDMNGRMWRFDIGDSNPSAWTGRIIFQSNSGVSEKRKIFYPPDVTLETESLGDYEMLYFGTGNREDPKGDKDIDRLYAFKDRNSMTILKEESLVNVTLDELQDPSIDQITKNQILADLQAKAGWYIRLDKQAGQKCLSSPVVYGKTAYFTTFSPTPETIVDPCLVGEGRASLFALAYLTGEAAFNLDLVNGLEMSRNDREITIGTGIPSGVSITIIGGKVVAYVGVGGGVYQPPLQMSKTLIPLYWKQIF
jgi:type IV pilus assembly protein PilY1